jgi:mono/diheme cytochrome c family protein
VKAFKVIFIIAFFLGMNAISYAQGPVGSGEGKKDLSYSATAGEKLFNRNCSRCHPNGGNVIFPNLPLIGSAKLENFKTFLSFIRYPKMPDGSEGIIPDFSKKQISDREAKTLYEYITGVGTSGMMGGGMGQGMMGGGIGQGMMGGGMGQGMMGGGMGQGMMGGGMGQGMMGGYNQSEECQKFLDDTAGLRKELYDKRFEYYEAHRNPKTTVETLTRLDREIFDLQKKIYVKAPLGCRW